MEEIMNSITVIRRSASVALAVLVASCATWHDMDRSEKGTAVGAVGGGVIGAAVGGPVGAAVGAGAGGYAGHYEAQPGGLAQSNSSAQSAGGSTVSNSSELVRSAQQSLNDKGYNVGPADGQLGPSTRNAVSRFQQAQGLRQTGELDSQTLSALGVSQR
jgi:uncharacterized protein YcfJ